MSRKQHIGVSRRNFLAATGAVAAAGLTGCIGGSGTIRASGSNTVAPITQEAAEAFQAEFDDVLVDVSPEGTGAGFSEFCQGNSDLQSASRLITDDEVEDCDQNGVEYSNYTVGLDGLAVVKHSDNDWVEEITLDELQTIWEFEATDEITHWSDVRGEWPDEEMILSARDSASGTFDYFTREINGEIGDIRDDYSATSQTNEIMDDVAADANAFGWGGLGYLVAAQEGGSSIEAVPVESDHPDYEGEFFPPEEQYIEGGQYSPLARPLFFYLNHETLQENPQSVGNFARHYINNQHEHADNAGFFAAPDETQHENHDRLDDLFNELGIEDDVTVEAERY